MPARLAALIDRVQAFAARHDRVLSVLSTLWLVLVSFSYAGFVDLPEIALLHGTPALVASTAWNGAWWGFIHPALVRRQRAREAAQEVTETA